jgi:hypothetical protein
LRTEEIATETQRHRDKQERKEGGVRGRVEWLKPPSHFLLFLPFFFSVPLYLCG